MIMEFHNREELRFQKTMKSLKSLGFELSPLSGNGINLG